MQQILQIQVRRTKIGLAKGIPYDIHLLLIYEGIPMRDVSSTSDKSRVKTYRSIGNRVCLVITGGALLLALGYMLNAHSLVAFILRSVLAQSTLVLAAISAAVCLAGFIWLFKKYPLLFIYFAFAGALIVVFLAWIVLTSSTLMNGETPVSAMTAAVLFVASLAFSICYARHCTKEKMTGFAACFLFVQIVCVALAGIFTDHALFYDEIAARRIANEKFLNEFPDTSYKGLGTIAVGGYTFKCSHGEVVCRQL